MELKGEGLHADEKMRRSYSQTLQEFMARQGSGSPCDIVDLGCASGLSSLELSETFHEANILGIDLSPQFLAVAVALQEARQKVRRMSRDVASRLLIQV